MALEIESVNPPSTFHSKDGDEKSKMAADLEDGEIEDGEIPDEEGVCGNEAPKNCEPEGTTVAQKNSPRTLSTQNEPVTGEVKHKLSSPKVKRSSLNSNSSVNNHKQVDGVVVEDDWAGNVEKAIKAAMTSKDGEQNVNENANASGSEINKTEEDEDGKIRKKKRKKKHREDQDERREIKKQKRNHISSKKAIVKEELDQGSGSDLNENDNDDDEMMLYVRGASPVMHSGYDSPSHGYHDDSFSYGEPGGPFDDSFCEDSDYEWEDYGQDYGHPPHCGENEGPKRGGGRGRGAKLCQQGHGRGRGGLLNKRRCGCKELPGNKGKRLQQKRPQQRSNKLMQRQGHESVCMFYMKGNCQMGDICPYSHDVNPPRKMELCKFYVVDRCAKKEKCLYMHSDFPCKFYHTGLKCFAGKHCKFSHGVLTDTLRAILLKHLETAPKELLGDFPRISPEGLAAMIHGKKNRDNKEPMAGGKKIPSLFEIEVPIPAQLLAQNRQKAEERSRGRQGTPMPESDNEDQEESWTTVSPSPKLDTDKTKDFSGVRHRDIGGEEREQSRMFRDGPDVKKEYNSEREAPRRSMKTFEHQDFSEQLQQLKLRLNQEKLNSSDEGEGNLKMNRHRHRRSKNKTAVDTEPETGGSGNSKQPKLHIKAESSPPPVLKDVDDRILSIEQNIKSEEEETMEIADDEGKLEIDDRHEDDDNIDDKEFKEDDNTPPSSSTQENVKKEQLDTDHNSNYSTESSGGLPLNLPKKQRELFLRIQQQQREALSSSNQAHSSDDDGKDSDAEQQQENWYSSDEEETSLADVLKNLSKQQPSSSPPRQSTTPPLPPAAAPPPLDNIQLSSINISCESISKLLSSIRQQQSSSSSTMTKPSETTHSRIPGQSHTSAPTTQARDPRLVSRDSCDRTSNLPTMTRLSPSKYDKHKDPRTSRRSSSSEERHQVHRTSIYSSAIKPSSTSTNATHQTMESGGDGDFSFHSSQQQPGTGFLSGTDVDLRKNVLMRTSSSSSSTSYMFGDTDILAAGPGGDMDARGILRLPFKPVPMHTPATEIDASLTSHPVIPYKVVPITIPWPDYSGLKLNISDPQVQNDPRLRKLFKIKSASIDSPASPSPPPQHASSPKQSPSIAARNDPRLRSTIATSHSSAGIQLHQSGMPMNFEMLPQNPMGLMHSTGMPMGITPNMPPELPYDPRTRNPRNRPGLLGPAPVLPNMMPKYF